MIIVLNQCTVHPSYAKIQNYCLQTWVRNKVPKVRVINYFGGYDSEDKPLDFDEVPEMGEASLYTKDGLEYLILGCHDLERDRDEGEGLITYDPKGLKQILALEYCLANMKFSHIYRTGCSSYVLLDRLAKFGEFLPTTRVYSGHKTGWKMYPQSDGDNKDTWFYYCLGCHVFMSRDVVEALVAVKDRYIELTTNPHAESRACVYEDVVAGRLLSYELNMGIRPESQINVPKVFNYKRVTKTSQLVVDDTSFNYRFYRETPELFYEFHKMVQ